MKLKAFTLASHGKVWEFDPADWSDDFVQDQVEQGLKIRLDRASASKPKKDGFSDAERLAECQGVYDKLAKGIIPAGGAGSRGPRQDAEMRADIAFLSSRVTGTVNGKNLETSWASYVAVGLVKAGKATVKDANLGDKVQKELPGIKAKVHQSADWKALLLAEQVKDGTADLGGFNPF